MKHNDFFKLCEEHTASARERHPEFCKKVSVFDAETIKKDLGFWRRSNACVISCQLNGDLQSLIEEEVNEFLLAAMSGDQEGARKEAADIVALLVRYLDGDMKEEKTE